MRKVRAAFRPRPALTGFTRNALDKPPHGSLHGTLPGRHGLAEGRVEFGARQRRVCRAACRCRKPTRRDVPNMRPGTACGTARRKSMPREIGPAYDARASEVVEAKSGVLTGFREPRGNIEDRVRKVDRR